jgi:hypothetical protein
MQRRGKCVGLSSILFPTGGGAHSASILKPLSPSHRPSPTPPRSSTLTRALQHPYPFLLSLVPTFCLPASPLFPPSVLVAISGLKQVSTFRAHPFKRPSLLISPHPNQYLTPHINNRYINSYQYYYMQNVACTAREYSLAYIQKFGLPQSLYV